MVECWCINIKINTWRHVVVSILIGPYAFMSILVSRNVYVTETTPLFQKYTFLKSHLSVG